MAASTTPDATHEEARQRLLLRQAELRSLLQRAAGAAVHAAEDPPELSDFKELAGQEAEQAVNNAATAQALRELATVEAALGRLREGRYGRCASCGEPIAAARLLAVPSATLCAACQGQQEHAGRGMP